ncbi:hypothetical protein LZ32DRAFT_612206 [Colletotrichum eremochloae]|nr:hypothetical protein LZ32DRAFT_612206 [Colletotrichum eremochloae]
MVGRATIVAGWPFTCSIDIDHVIEDDMIAIFQPDDPTLAPVLSQVFRRPAAEWATQATQPMMCRIDQNSSLNRSLQHQTTTTVLDSSIDGDMSSVVDNGINTTNTVQPGSHTNHRSSDLFAFPSQFDQPDCNSRPYPPPYADSSNSASDLTLDTHSDELNAPFVTNSDLKTQETAVEDRCIVVIPLP